MKKLENIVEFLLEAFLLGLSCFFVYTLIDTAFDFSTFAIIILTAILVSAISYATHWMIKKEGHVKVPQDKTEPNANAVIVGSAGSAGNTVIAENKATENAQMDDSFIERALGYVIMTAGGNALIFVAILFITR